MIGLEIGKTYTVVLLNREGEREYRQNFLLLDFQHPLATFRDDLGGVRVINMTAAHFFQAIQID